MFVSDPEQVLMQFDAFLYWNEVDAPDFRRFCSIVRRMVGLPRISVSELLTIIG